MSTTNSIQLIHDPQHVTQQLQTVAEQVLAQAKQQGASAVEVAASVDNGFSLTVRLGDVETVEYQRDNGVGITVYFDKCKGSASTTDLTATAVKDAVNAACQFAQYAANDPCAGLADADLMATTLPDLDLYHPWSLQLPEAIELALTAEQAARDLDKRITNSDGASVSTSNGVRLYANSHGFVGTYASSYHSVSCMPVASDNTDMQRDYSYTVARDPAQLDNAIAIGKQAAERTLARLQAKPIATTQVPVILQADIARGFVGHFVSAISGASQYRKASFLLDKLHQSVCAKTISIDEQPHLPKAMGSRAFDGDGVATRAKTFVENGQLQSYILGSYSARKLNQPTTANAGGVNNLIISHTEMTLPQLCQHMGTGLLVTELIGHGVNIVIGDYSQGAAGFWVENGVIQYPVAEITIAGNLGDLWLNMVAVANDIDRRGRIHSGSILLEQMTVAGK